MPINYFHSYCVLDRFLEYLLYQCPICVQSACTLHGYYLGLVHSVLEDASSLELLQHLHTVHVAVDL